MLQKFWLCSDQAKDSNPFYTKAARAYDMLHAQAIQCILQYIAQQQNPDGGFQGKAKESDLYYTFFGLASWYALAGPTKQELPQLNFQTLWNWLLTKLQQADIDFIHRCCLIRSLIMVAHWKALHEPIGNALSMYELLSKLVHSLETYRQSDGGYSAFGKPPSTLYDTFLASETYQDAQIPMPDSHKLSPFVWQYQTKDKAFANLPQAEIGSTTATGAAIQILQSTRQPIPISLVHWILQRYDLQQGGFYASPQAAIPDLLSTSVALYTLASDQQLEPLSIELVKAFLGNHKKNCQNFLELLWHENGGFCGTTLELLPDCEYTFYALLAMGCLAEA